MTNYNDNLYNVDINNNINERLSDLQFEENLGLLFALGSLLNIFGIEKEKNDLINNKDSTNSKLIFLFVLFLSLYVYIRIFFRNKHNYQEALENINNRSVFNNNIFNSSIRLFASIFFITAVILSIFFEIQERFPTPPEI